MGPTDIGWTYCGWNIDDVRICGYRLPLTTPTPTTPTPTPPPPTTPTTPPGSPTHTPPPTETSTQMPSPTAALPTHTPVPPTGTSPPTHTQSPSTETPVLPTHTPGCSALGVELWMPAVYFRAGDPCGCKVYLCNPESGKYPGLPLFVILDVYGSMYFAPSFDAFDYYSIDLEPGRYELGIIKQFPWPEGAGSATGIVWIAGMTDPGITRLIGEMDIWEFGWGV
ncbi:hypothetical protein JXA40_09495 [bacterium]|nr:hypothetical protein [candidate division CSSED10-310 bacterium]